MNEKELNKLLKITLDKLEQSETEITLLKYDKEHLQREIEKLKKKEDVKQVMKEVKSKMKMEV